MACSCTQCTTPKAEVEQAKAAWSCNVDRSQRAGSVAIARTGAAALPGVAVGGLAALQTAKLAEYLVHPVNPPEGRGWVELSSPQAFVVWAVSTSQNGVQRTEYRRTGPASRAGVYVERGAVVRYWVAGVMPYAGDTTLYEVNPQSGIRSAVAFASATAPTANARFWAGSTASEFQSASSYAVMLNGAELGNTQGTTVTVGYPTGYASWVAASFGRASTWKLSDDDISSSSNATQLEVYGSTLSAAIGPWSFLLVDLDAAGSNRDGVIVWSTYPNGNSSI